MMDTLNDDALRAVLIRTCAADHPALRQTCKRVCKTIDSIEFRQERAILGYTEVDSVELLDPYEQYKASFDADYHEREPSPEDEDFLRDYDEIGDKTEGYHDLEHFSFRISVDGAELGMESLQVLLLPRKINGFFELCESASQELIGLVPACFDEIGNFRLDTLKDIVPESDGRPLLYIAAFELPMEYRSLESPVGPLILQHLLSHSRLKSKWSVAMYVPYNKAQATLEDSKQMSWLGNLERQGEMDDLSSEDRQTMREVKSRQKDLTCQDARMFFRAGFHQIKEKLLLEQISSYILYAIPSEVEGCDGKPKLISVSEALQTEIARTGETTAPEMSIEEEELFEKLRKCSTHSRRLRKELTSFQTPIWENPMLMGHPVLQQFREQRKKIRRMRNQASDWQAKRVFVQELLTGCCDRTANVEQLEGSRRSLLSLIREEVDEHLQGLLPTLDGLSLDLDCPTFEAKSSYLVSMIDAVMATYETSNSMFEETFSTAEAALRESIVPMVAEKEKEIREYDEKIRTEIQSMLTDSQSSKTSLILNSNSIHACAFNLEQSHLDFLLTHFSDTSARVKAVNSRDGQGYTPLMVVVSNDSLDEEETERQVQLIEYLFEKGADSTLTTGAGLTALGVFRRSCQSTNDFEATFSSSRRASKSRKILGRHRQVETLLRPTNGPTAADDKFPEAEDPRDLSDEDEWDDDDSDGDY